MTIYAVVSASGMIVAYFVNNVDAYAFLRYNYLYNHIETYTVANTFFTTGVNALPAVDTGLSPFPA